MSGANPYAPPQSEVQSPQPHGTANLETAVRGEYDYKIGEVMSEAWQRLPGSKGKIWGAAIVFGITSTLLQVPISALLGVAFIALGVDSTSLAEEGNSAGMIAIGLSSVITQIFVTAPLTAGFYLIAIKHVAGKPTGVGELFAHFNKIVPLAIVNFLMMIAIYVGFALLILPGIYLAYGLMFAMPLVVTHDLSPMDALKTSLKAVHHHWFRLFGLMLAGAIVVMLSMFFFLIPLIWALPWLMVAASIVFVRMFGTDWPVER